ncbi:MAG: FHA domain-containing protein [Acidobacteria bacterium]|nr:MAG: FHA domain-containing protein [Acidobacteriota bacterium]REK01248.1 MAG: FHA domain-containing protein [Acidobacteriota bacterium]REK14204.1 MAG: FHA domain-containing protein [Acidobacteriota bacterium]REK44919.1 MAG: FHA domain-containing protein [Acidobacteriota bacterium]
MTEEKGSTAKKSLTLDWLVGGVLSKLGDTFDRVTGRKWNPSSNLATSKLEEKLKLLLDSEARNFEDSGTFVPHIFKLKIQWNKFSTDSDAELRKLEHELHAAAIDHINDRLYHTYEPILVTVEKDYFVEGVQFIASFGKFAESEDDEVAVNVTLKNIPVGGEAAFDEPAVEEAEGAETSESEGLEVCFEFSLKGAGKRACVTFGEQRRFSIGRTGSNDIVIDDISISKTHAAVAMNRSGEIVVADTGSTNGTFIGSDRMAYGKAASITNGSRLRFGDVEVIVSVEETDAGEIPDEPAPVDRETVQPTESYVVEEPAPTIASDRIDVSERDKREDTKEDWEV